MWNCPNYVNRFNWKRKCRYFSYLTLMITIEISYNMNANEDNQQNSELTQCQQGYH